MIVYLQVWRSRGQRLKCKISASKMARAVTRRVLRTLLTVLIVLLVVSTIQVTRRREVLLPRTAWTHWRPLQNFELPLANRSRLASVQLYMQPREPRKTHGLWPSSDLEEESDRILEQLAFVPPEVISAVGPAPLKTIFLYHGVTKWDKFLLDSRQPFLDWGCAASTCQLSTDWARRESAHAVLFRETLGIWPLNWRRSPDQVWVWLNAEPPHFTAPLSPPHVFNWTATYRRDSDLVVPYARWISHGNHLQSEIPPPDIAANKTKQVAMFTSNCGDRSGRLMYARVLSRHIGVDIFGKCGALSCPRQQSSLCLEMLEKHYKFYLAFENSNCRHYVSEKLFETSFRHKVLPIVMGAPRVDYELVSPPHSFVHVDDFASPRELAAFLHRLDTDDRLYNEYFRWHNTGEIILDTKLYCRLCALLHDPASPRQSYPDINRWWRGEDAEVCITDTAYTPVSNFYYKYF